MTDIMTKHIDSNLATPIPAQVRSLIEEEIVTGTFRRGQKIPSERDLAQKYAASRASVREAILELVADDVLFRTGGRGTFVSQVSGVEPISSSRIEHIAFWIDDEIFHFVEAGYTRILTGVEEVCRDKGLTVRFHSINGRSESLEKLFALINSDTSVGNILAGDVSQDIIDRLHLIGQPVILVDSIVEREGDSDPRLRIDYAHGTRVAIDHLAKLGHKEIGFIGFANSDRYDSFWRTLEQLGLPYNPRHVSFLQMRKLAPGILSGYRSMAKMISAGELPTAMIVVNDFAAMGALAALQISGLSVPEDMSLVGFDDLGQGDLPLTTVRVNLMEVGRAAARLMLEPSTRSDRSDITFPVEFVIRSSTAAPKVNAR